jgi:hypothetical protein
MHRTERAGEGDRQTTLVGELPSIVLEITRGRAKHLRREVRGAAFVIGAAPDCDLVLGDPRFPEVHSYLFVARDRVTIRQLAPEPELKVGGRSVTCQKLADLDTLQLGPYEFRVLIQWPQAMPRIKPSEGGTVEMIAGQIRHEWALERLLRDVEAYSATPRLSLFVGDAPETDEPAPKPTSADRAFWRPAQRKAIS